MKSTELKRLITALQGLSADECLKVQEALKGRQEKVQVSAMLVEMESAVSCCPHCGCTALKPAGSKGGRKRFKCKACLKTFNAYTGTSLARLRMAEKHIENAECMIKGMSIRDTAEKLGVAIQTAFRWRHRFLDAIRDEQPETLSGMVEADETFFLESFKGQRSGIPRKPKKRGGPAKKRGLSKEQIPVIVARDRHTKATLTAKLPSRKAKDIGAVLVPKLSADSLLCTDGARAYKTIGKNNGIEVKSTKAKKSAGAFHLNNVNAYDSRLKGWMFPFHGVATKYLDNYLGWHRLLDKAEFKMADKEFLAAVSKVKP